MRPLRTLRNIGSCQCRYIPGEPAGENTLYCGEPTAPGKSYCATHCAVIYRKATPSERRLYDEMMDALASGHKADRDDDRTPGVDEEIHKMADHKRD
jgi:hypothetical protein